MIWPVIIINITGSGNEPDKKKNGKIYYFYNVTFYYFTRDNFEWLPIHHSNSLVKKLHNYNYYNIIIPSLFNAKHKPSVRNEGLAYYTTFWSDRLQNIISDIINVPCAIISL